MLTDPTTTSPAHGGEWTVRISDSKSSKARNFIDNRNLVGGGLSVAGHRPAGDPRRDVQAMGLAHGERRVDGDVGLGAQGVPDPSALWEPQLASSAAAGSGAASRRCSA
jgi:hypothetical protein